MRGTIFVFSLLVLFSIQGNAETAPAQRSSQQTSGKAFTPISSNMGLKMDEKVETTFSKAMMKCKEKTGCSGFKDMGTSRDPNASWGAKCSCHKLEPPKAIDVGSLDCGSEVTPESGAKGGKYKEFVECMVEFATDDPNANFKVIYGFPVTVKGGMMNNKFTLEPKDHKDHFHIQMDGCVDDVKKAGRCKSGDAQERSGDPDRPKK